jgi:hypothetical protein
LVDYRDAEVSKYVRTLVEIVKKETERTGTDSLAAETLWENVCLILSKRFCKDNSQQPKLTIEFFCSLSGENVFHVEGDDIKHYIYEYYEISNNSVQGSRLTSYDQMLLFLQSLPEKLPAKGYLDLKLDVDEPKAFMLKDGFGSAVQFALTMNRLMASIEKLRRIVVFTQDVP